MARGKLSQQIKRTSDQRLSRTERRKLAFQEKKERQEFESLRSQAKQVQEAQFKDKIVTETYQVEVPDWDKIKKFEPHLERDLKYKWDKIGDYTKNKYLNHWRRMGYLRQESRTRQKTIPFTIDEGTNTYAQVYASLGGKLKQFFQTPEEIKQSKSSRIQDTKLKIQEKFTYAAQKIKEAKEKYDQKITANREWFDRKKGDERDRARESFNKNETQANDDYEEKLEKWRGYKQGLGEAKGKLDQGQEISFSDAEQYAYDVGAYYEDREEARNEQRIFKRTQQRKIDDLISKGYKPMLIQEFTKGKPTGSKVTFYSAEEKKYAKLDLKLKTTDVTKLEPSAIKKAKISQAFVLGGKKFTFETTEPVFKTRTGQLTTAFGGLGKTEAQVLQEQKEQIQKQEREFGQKASQYLETTGFSAAAKEDVKAKDLSFWQKIKAAYLMTPFGTKIPTPEKYSALREERTTKFGEGFVKITGTTIPKISFDITKADTLTWQQSMKAIKEEELKKSTAEKQVALIEKLSVVTEEAPKDLQYFIQQKGFAQLEKAGVLVIPSTKEKDLLGFQTDGKVVFKDPEEFAKEVNRLTGATSFTKAVPTKFVGEKLFVQDINFRFDEKGNIIYKKETGERLMEKEFFLKKDKARQERLLKEAGIDEQQIEFKSKAFEPSKSYNLYQWEKAEGKKFDRVVYGSAILSKEVLKTIGIVKGIGYGIAGVGFVGGKVYAGVGGGLRIADISMKGQKVVATVTQATGKSKLLTVGKYALGLGIGGVYTYSKVKQYQYQKEAFGKAGEQVFFLETGGEAIGFGTVAAGSLIKRANIKKIQKQAQQQNYLKELRSQELKNIKQYGKLSRGARLEYKQVGTGREVLSDKGIQSLAKQYSKVTGVSQKQAAKMVSEKGIYEQVFKVKSDVPSYERALKYLRTGKAPKTTSKYYEIKRYGISTAQRTAKGYSALDIEFKLRGKDPTNIVLKLTQAKGKYGITHIFEKAKYSPKDPMAELRLKEVFVTKGTEKAAKINEIKFFLSKTESRLVKMFPYGKERLTVKEALEIGKIKPSQTEFKSIWTKAGSLKKAYGFESLRVEAPLFRGTGKIKIAKESEYLFGQVGKGKAGLPMKKVRFDLVDDLLKQMKKDQLRSTLKQSRAARGLKGLDLEVKTDVGKLVQKQLKKVPVEVSLKHTQISPTIQTTPKIKTAVRLKEIPIMKDQLLLQLATGQMTRLKSRQKSQQALRSKQIQRQDLSLKQIQKLELGLKQIQRQKQQMKQVQAPAMSVAQMVDVMLKTPMTRTPTPTTAAGKVPAFVLPTVPKLKKILKQKIKERKTYEEFYYVPDFTSRAIGLKPIDITTLVQAKKLLRKTHTGLELRRAVRVKIPQ